MPLCIRDALSCLNLLIILVMSFLSYPLFCKASFRWLSCVCRCSLSEVVKVFSTSELLTVFVLSSGATRHVDIYLCVFSIHLTKVPSAFLEYFKKGEFSVSFYIYDNIMVVYSPWIFGLLRKMKNLRNLALPCFHITNVSFI